jgi:uncharacterized Zn finger protein
MREKRDKRDKASELRKLSRGKRAISARKAPPTKAASLLAEGRLTVTGVDGERIAATCQGDTGVWQLSWQRGRGWRCTCPALGFGRRCSHLAALMLVTEPAPRVSTRRPLGATQSDPGSSDTAERVYGRQAVSHGREQPA